MEPVVKDLDLSAINLVVDDRDPQAIFDDSLARFLELAPTASIRNGSVEALLMEALCVATADGIYAVNRFIGKVIEGVLNLYDIARDPGSPASGVVTLTLDGSRTLTVTAGQRLVEPVTGVVLLVEADTSVTSAASIALPVVTADSGGAGNAITAGMAVDLLDAIPYVASAQVTTGLTGGADAESDAAYVDRATAVLARVTSSLVLPSHFVAYLLQDPRVARATAIDLYEPGGTIGADLGSLTTYTYGRGAQLSATVREELRAAMQAICSAMVTVYVEEADIVTQDVEVTVQALPGYSTPDVSAAVTAAITAWMSPEAWTWGRDILPTEIIDVVADVAGVDYVTSVTTPAGNVTLTDDQLAAAGTITVTVTS